jgi:Fe-S cluster assembly iron-binding protein IscA
LTLDESKDNKDNQIDADGLKILYDEQVKMTVEKGKPVIIDYIESHNGSGFTIDTGASCGSGCEC